MGIFGVTLGLEMGDEVLYPLGEVETVAFGVEDGVNVVVSGRMGN